MIVIRKSSSGGKKIFRALHSFGILLLVLIGMVYSSGVNAQTYPVNVTVQIVPPFSPYLNDYLTDINKVRLLITNTQRSEQKIRFSIKLTGEKVSIYNDATWKPAQGMTLDGGAFVSANGDDLAPYFNSAKVTLNGVSSRDLLSNKPLPEGNYSLCVVALDYATGKPVSDPNAGCANFYIRYAEAPVITGPVCGDSILSQSPQNITFTWQGAAVRGIMEYKFKIVDVTPLGRNPGDAMNSATTPTFFETTTNAPFYHYTISDPTLIAGHKYAFRVIAIDPNQKVYFLNKGMSEICWFVYKDPKYVIASYSNKVNIPAKPKTPLPGKTHISGNINYYFNDPGKWANGVKFSPNNTDSMMHKPNHLPVTSISLITACQWVKRIKVPHLYAEKDDGKGAPAGIKNLKNMPPKTHIVMDDSIPSYMESMEPIVEDANSNLIAGIGKLGTAVATVFTDSNGFFTFDINTSAYPCKILDSAMGKMSDAAKNKTINSSTLDDYSKYGYYLLRGYALKINNKIYWDPQGFFYLPEGSATEANDMKTGIKNYSLQVIAYTDAWGALKGQKGTIYILKKQHNPKFPKTEGDGIKGTTINIVAPKDNSITGATNGTGLQASPLPLAGASKPAGLMSPGSGASEYFPPSDGTQYIVISKAATDFTTIDPTFDRLLSQVDPGDEYYIYVKMDKGTILFSPAEYKIDLVTHDNPLYNPITQDKWLPKTHMYLIEPKFVDLTVSGRMLYNWSGANGGRTAAKPVPNHTRVKLINATVVKGLGKNVPIYQNQRDVAITYTDEQGNFSFQVGKLDYDKYFSITFGAQGKMYVVVDNPYYYSPSNEIHVNTGESKNAGDLIAYVKECTYKGKVVKSSSKQGDPLVGMNVFLCRKATDNFTSLPPDEGVENKSVLTKSKLWDKNKDSFIVIEQRQTDGNGVFPPFDRVVLNDLSNNLDEYYVIAESQVGNLDNYLTEQAMPRLLNSGGETNKIQTWEQELPTYDVSNAGYNYYIKAQPQLPYIVGGVYPISNTSTSSIVGAYVEMFDMGDAKFDLNHDFYGQDNNTLLTLYGLIGQQVTFQTEITQYTDDNGVFRFDIPNPNKSGWKLLRVSKEGFLPTIVIVNNAQPLQMGTRAELKKVLLALPLDVTGNVTDTNNQAVPAKIIVGDGFNNNFSWANAVSYGGDKVAKAPLKCPSGHVRFIVIPDDHNLYYTDTFYRDLSTSAGQSLTFVLKERKHIFNIICRDSKTGKSINAHATITNMPTPMESKDVWSGLPGQTKKFACSFIFKNTSTSFNIRVVPEGDYQIGYITVNDDITNQTNTNGVARIFYVDVQASTSISGKVYLKSNPKDLPMSRAKVFIEELNDEFSMDVSGLDGSYSIKHLPIGKKITLDAAVTGNYVGDMQKFYTKAEPITKNLFVTEFKDFDITSLLNFPMEVTKLEPTAGGAYIWAKIKVGEKSNSIFKSGADANGYVTISNVKFKSGPAKKKNAGLPPCRPTELPVVADENTYSCLANTNYLAIVTDALGLKIAEYKEGYGALDGFVYLDPATFSKGFAPHSAVYLNLFGNDKINVPVYTPTPQSGGNGQFKYTFPGVANPSTDVIHTLTADGVAPSDYSAGFRLSDSKLNSITYSLNSVFTNVTTTNKSLFKSFGLVLASVIHTNLEHVDNPDIMLNATVNVYPSVASSLQNNNEISIPIGNWAVVSSNWSVTPKGIELTSGHVTASGLTVPFTDMLVTEKYMGFGNFDFSTLKILDAFTVAIDNKTALSSFGYDKGFGDKGNGVSNGAWSLSILKSGDGPLATITGLPDLELTDKIYIANINLYSTGDSKVILDPKQPPLKLNGLATFTPGSVFGTTGYLMFRGALDFEIPYVTGLGQTLYDLKYTVSADNNGTKNLIHSQDLKFKGLEMKVNGVDVTLNGDQIFNNGMFQIKGTLKDEHPGSKYTFNIVLEKTKTYTKLYLDNIGFPKQNFPIGKNGKATLEKLTGQMNLSTDKNIPEWTPLSFEGDLTGETGIDVAKNHMKFVVNGDLVCKGSTIGITNMDAGPIHDLNLTLDFEKYVIVGSGKLEAFDIGAGTVDMDVEFQLGDGKYYIFGAGKIHLKDMPAGLNEISSVFMAGYTEITAEQLATMESYFHEGQAPETFKKDMGGTLSGIIFIAGLDVPVPLIPTINWDLPMVKLVVEDGIFANMYCKVGFDGQYAQFAVGGVVGVWVHVGVGVTAVVACVMIDLKATVSAAFTGTISNNIDLTRIHMDITLKLEGSAHGGVGVCNADCETPCVHIPIVGEVCSPIPCVNKTLSKTLIAPLGVTIDHTGVSVDQPKFF